MIGYMRATILSMAVMLATAANAEAQWVQEALLPFRVPVKVENKTGAGITFAVDGYLCGRIPAGWEQTFHVLTGVHEFRAGADGGWQLAQNFDTRLPFTWRVENGGSKFGPREPTSPNKEFDRYWRLLGVQGTILEGGGMRIDAVPNGSVGSWMRLAAGEVITEVNGQRFRNLGEYYAALDAGKDRTEIVVRRNGRLFRIHAAFGATEMQSEELDSRKLAVPSPEELKRTSGR